MSKIEERLNNLERHANQNQRMREWFKKRTGLDTELLSAHIDEIDEILEENCIKWKPLLVT